MDPAQLREWEPILQSQVAVSLLLLAALIGTLGWCFALYRTNQAREREFREYLQTQVDFGRVLDNAQALIELARETAVRHDRAATPAD